MIFNVFIAYASPLKLTEFDEFLVSSFSEDTFSTFPGFCTIWYSVLLSDGPPASDMYDSKLLPTSSYKSNNMQYCYFNVDIGFISDP